MVKGAVTAILRNFSSSNNNSKWYFYEDDRIEDILYWFSPLIYANGNCKENEGYVSITVKYEEIFLPVRFPDITEIRCYMSVVDVAGKKRFTQSVIYVDSNPKHLCNEFGLERYLKRETLISDPADLLPDDCLTIRMDVELIFSFPEHFKSASILFKTDKPIGIDEFGKVWISLDSAFGRDLCRVSKYFRCASDTPMIESRTRKVCIEAEERSLFRLLFFIFYGSGGMTIPIAAIWDLYRAADKYDIQPLFETCRQFVKAILRMAENPKSRGIIDEFVPEILEQADHYRDEDLKAAVEIYLECKENFGTDNYALGIHLKDRLYTEWKCISITGNIPRLKIIKIEDSKFEFYQ